jgi:hypothetical protein
MALKIPLFDHPNFSQSVTLDGKVYLLKLGWNDRGAYWTIGFYKTDGTPLVTCRKILLGQELVHFLPGLGLPPGSLMAVDDTGKLTSISRTDLATGRVKLRYIPEADL